MRKKGAILVLAVFLAVILCGAVSAASSSTTGGVNVTAKNSSKSVVDPVIGVKVNYEYSFDKNINPTIVVRDSKGSIIKVTKTYDYALHGYKVNFDHPGVVNGTKFRVTLSAPGYVTQSKTIAVFQHGLDPNFYGSSTFNMKARMNYKLGKEITSRADGLLKFKDADGVLCITTAGLVYRNGYTTEDTIEGILNRSFGKISYGKGNLLTLRKTRNDPLDIAFIVRKGSSLTALFFKNGSLKATYYGTFSTSISQKTWEKVIVPTFGDDAFGYISLANAWAQGLPTDTLRQAAFHGHVCLGTISGQAMIQTLLRYYPAISDTGLPLEGVSYQVLGVPGNSDDDAFIYSMDSTPGKRAYVGIGTMVGTEMAGFIRWNSVTKLGTLIIMKFNEQAVTSLYKKETGFKAYAGISSELQFNKWLVSKLKNHPESMVTIVKELEGLTEDQYHYLMGYEPNKGNTTVQAHGLDMKYINKLGLKKAKRANNQYATGKLTPAQIKQIGINAARKATELFKAMGINLQKDDPNLTVLTSAGYVRLNGQTTDMTMDGIYSILGSRLSRATLLPVHSALWKPLVFEFAYRNGTEIITKTMHYDLTTNQLVVDKKQTYNIEDVLLYDPPYDALMAWLFHNHVCGGSSPGYLIADHILTNYPLGKDEKYIYVTTLDNCKDDILQYLLGVSAGAGTYYNQRLTTQATSVTGEGGMNGNVGYIIRWNEKLQIGEVVIINWESPKFADGSISLEEYIKLYKRNPSNKLLKAPVVSAYAKKWITKSEFDKLLSSETPLADILELPNRKKSDLLPVNNGGSQNSQNSGQNQGSGSNSLSAGSVGLVGAIGANVVAATLNTATVGALPAGDSGKAYEVSKTTSEGSTDSPWGVAAIVGVLAVLGLGAIGFLFKGSLFGR